MLKDLLVSQRRIHEGNCKQQTLTHLLILTAREKYFQKTPPPHYLVKIKIEQVLPAPNIEVIKRAYKLIGVQGKDYEVISPDSLKKENDEEAHQFLEHVAAQNAPDPWDCITESVSITSLHSSQDGFVNLLLNNHDHDETKPTTIIAVAESSWIHVQGP
jgi:hypothetical protein